MQSFSGGDFGKKHLLYQISPCLQDWLITYGKASILTIPGSMTYNYICDIRLYDVNGGVLCKPS